MARRGSSRHRRIRSQRVPQYGSPSVSSRVRALLFSWPTTHRRASISARLSVRDRPRMARRGDGDMEMESLKELYVDELKDLWSAEAQIKNCLLYTSPSP